MSQTAAVTATEIHIKLPQEQMLEALGITSRAVAKHSIQPLLNNILIRADAESQSVKFAATDLDLGLLCEVNCVVLAPGEITLPAQKALELVSKLPPLEVSLLSNGHIVTIRCGRSKSELSCLASDAFPTDFMEQSLDANSKHVSIPAAQLKEVASMVGFASDKREVNSILNGICFEWAEGSLDIAATDGSRLAHYRCNTGYVGEARKMILPHRALGELSRCLSLAQEGEMIECFTGKERGISFRGQRFLVSSSLIEGNYPKYQQLIPSIHANKATLERTALIAALERVAVMANERTKVIKLLFERIGILTIKASTPDLGEAQDQIDLLHYDGVDFSIGFNVNYLLECLRNLNCEQVELKMSEPLKPLVVTPVGSEDKAYEYLYLLMPVQMKN